MLVVMPAPGIIVQIPRVPGDTIRRLDKLTMILVSHLRAPRMHLEIARILLVIAQVVLDSLAITVIWVSGNMAEAAVSRYHIVMATKCRQITNLSEMERTQGEITLGCGGRPTAVLGITLTRKDCFRECRRPSQIYADDKRSIIITQGSMPNMAEMDRSWLRGCEGEYPTTVRPT
jgi:hypothetical protein